MGLPCLYLPEPIWKEKSYPLLSQKREIVEVSWNSTWEPEELKNTCESFKQSLINYEEQITAPNLSQPAPNKHLNDLHKQGFFATQEGNTYQPYNVDLRNIISFDIQPTNPQADITATGHCENWITTIDLMEYQEKITLSSPDGTMLPEVYTDTVACIYNVDGNCKGMLTSKRLNILRKAFHTAKCSGLHDHVQPPPISFASELVGLIARKETSASKYANKKIQLFCTDTSLPQHRRLSKVGPLKKKWHVPSTMTPNSPITGVSTQGTKCLGPMPSPPVILGSPSAIPFTMKTPCS